MRKSLAVIAGVLLVVPILSAVQAQSLGTPENDTPSLWFVELSSPPMVDGSTLDKLEAEEASFHAAAGKAGLRYTKGRHFHRLWNGVTVSASRSEAAKLEAISGVRSLYPVMKVKLQLAEARPGNGTDMITALSMTGADIAQSEIGVTGKGVKVAVIDTGIDYDHPDLGGCFGPGCRVEKGFDFVGDAYNPNTGAPPVPDPFPDDCNGHGTHVSGILGANGTIKGVAPDVTFHAYRVFGCDGPTTDDIILAAMEMALEDGADIMNMSLGISFGWPQYPTAQGADRLVRLGMVVVASIGNDGSTGLYSASAPGDGKNVIGVASFDNISANLPAFAVSPDGTQVGYFNAVGAPDPPMFGTFPMARTGTTASLDDACNSLPAGTLSGKVVLIRRGTCSFFSKAANAQAAGAAGVILYNNAPGYITPIVSGSVPITIPVVLISAVKGALINDLLAGGPVDMTWTPNIVSEPQPTGNLISSFSSFGLPPDLSFKPDIGAPGGTIRSTLPLEQGGFGILSGTSMSSPYVAGAVALLLEARPGTEVNEVRARLQNTARPHHPATSGPLADFLDNVHRQGAGMLEVDDAILADAFVMPSRIALGEIESGSKLWTIHIRRDRSPILGRGRQRGRRDVVYTLVHEPALSSGPNTFTPTFSLSFGTVQFSTPKVALGGANGNEASILVTFTPPSDSTARLFGGYITLTPDDDGPILRVPYAGYNGDYQAIRVLTPTPVGFPLLAKLVGTSLIPQPNGATFSLQGTDVPYFLLHLDHPAAELKMEIIDVESGRSFKFADKERLLPRNSSASSFFLFAWDGTAIRRIGDTPQPVPDGTYRIELSVLKALGDPHNPAHFERWTSPNVTIERPVSP